MAHASSCGHVPVSGRYHGFCGRQLWSLSDGRQNLSSVIGGQPDSRIMVVNYTMRIKDMVESKFIDCISARP